MIFPVTETTPVASTFRHPSAFIPVAMSISAIAVIAVHIVLHGTQPQADEGTAAHLWQLLMALQLPVILFFAARWLPRAPRAAVAILAVQFLAGVAAAAPVFIFHW